MNEEIKLLLFGLGFLVFGGGGIYLLLIAAERVCQWIADLSETRGPR